MPPRTFWAEVEVDHPLGDGPIVPVSCRTPVVNGVLKVEKNMWLQAVIAVVDQHRAALQERAVPFQSQIEHGIEKRVSGTNKGRVRLSRGRDKRLLELDALVAGGHRLRGPYVVGPSLHHRGHP